MQSDSGDVTPGCTDYTPRHDKVLKQEPTYAPQRAVRWNECPDKELTKARPHVYEDPNQRTFRRSNSGSFARAKRFSTPIDGSQVRAYLISLKSRNASAGRQHSMGNLASASSKGKFYITQGTTVNKFDASSTLNVQEARQRVRPSTETGRMRVRRNTTQEVSTTADVTGHSPD